MFLIFINMEIVGNLKCTSGLQPVTSLKSELLRSIYCFFFWKNLYFMEHLIELLLKLSWWLVKKNWRRINFNKKYKEFNQIYRIKDYSKKFFFQWKVVLNKNHSNDWHCQLVINCFLLARIFPEVNLE